MDKINLHDELIAALYDKIPKRADLVNKVSEILRIEKEPAYRRLNGKVQFSVQEMGLLANSLNISLDALLRKEMGYQWIPFILDSPMQVKSIEILVDFQESCLIQMRDIMQGPSEYASVFNSIPLEFYIFHPYLMKFMYFKWGYYFVGTDEFNDFAHWELPERFIALKDLTESIISEMTSVVYIWDDALIWTLVKEIEFFYKMHVISVEDKDLIKNDLKNQLTTLEKYIKGVHIPKYTSANVSFYVSSISTGVTSWCLSSGSQSISHFKTHFTRSPITNDYDCFVKIKEWIDSLKNISLLLSRSGQLERRLYFKKQHEIIDLVLG